MQQNYNMNNAVMQEADRIARTYPMDRVYQIYQEVCNQLEDIEARFNYMQPYEQQQAGQAYDTLKFQHAALEVVLSNAQRSRQPNVYGGYQQQGYNRFQGNSVTSLNVHNEPQLVTRTTTVGFGNKQPQQPTTRSGQYVRPSIVQNVNHNHSHTQPQQAGVAGVTRKVLMHNDQPQQQTQPKQEEGVYMCAKIEGGMFPYATVDNVLTTDGKELGFVLGSKGKLIPDALINIDVNPNVAYFAFKSDNGYTPTVSPLTDKGIDDVEPMKNLILTLSKEIGAPVEKVNYLITDIILTLLKREGVRGVDNIISKDVLIKLDEWVVIDKYIVGEDTTAPELSVLNKISKRLNQVKFSKNALYSFLYEYVIVGYSFVEGNFINNLVEVIADVRNSYEFLNFLNLSNFDTFKLTEEANPTLYKIVEKAYESVKEAAFLLKSPSKFCKITLFLRDESGFEYSLVVDQDRVNGDAYYINNTTRSVIVNQGVSNESEQGK